MNKNYLFILMLSLSLSSSLASQKIDVTEFSLFYTDDELKELTTKVEKNIKSQDVHKIHLKALFYSNPQIWTLWINDLKISSNEPQVHYKIQCVTSEHVILDWKHQGKIHRVQLRPNQSYDATSDQISEGL